MSECTERLGTCQPVGVSQSPDIAELAAALSKAQGEFKPSSKGTENPFLKSKYADLNTHLETIRPTMAKHGLSVLQRLIPTPDAITLETMVMHSSGQWISGALVMKPMKPDPQSCGSALTYARRYSLAAMLGLSAEDDDAHTASVPANGARAKKPMKTKTMDF